MKILYVHHCSGTGGASNSLRILLETLKNNLNLDITVLCPPGASNVRFVDSGLKVITTPVPFFFQPTYGINFQWINLIRLFFKKKHFKLYEDLFKHINPDIIHFNDVGLYPYVRLAKKNNFKTVLHLRVVLREYFNIKSIIEKNIDNYCDCLISIDKSASNSILLKKTKKIIIYNPCVINQDIINFYPDYYDKNKFNVIFVSNLLKHKGVIDVLKTAKRLKNERAIRFIIAGSNVKSYKFYSSLLGRLLHCTGIYINFEKYIYSFIRRNELKNLDFLGQVSDVNGLLKESQILLMPNHMNEPSRSVYEAGVLGLPSIITLKNKFEDIVIDKYSGYIVGEKRIDEISNRILSLFYNRGLLESFGKNAKINALKKHNCVSISSDVYQIYKSLSSTDKCNF